MAPFFRKRLQCFYCGCRSAQSQTGKIRQWQCRECQAVNYLDENGEITDPPATAASFESQRPQYARPLSQFQPARSADFSIFCSTCQKNQYLLTETLASYLPPPSHPEYEVYEASYPAYRKSLEERYPQVCENCEPKVIERIRQAGYEAKADHLRRMMEQSRGGRSLRNRRKWRWRSLFVSAGAMASCTSVAGQLCWNAMGCLADATSVLDSQQPVHPSRTLLRSCLSQGVEYKRMDGECALSLQPYAGLALVLGVLSLWWNPKLRYKVDGKSGRISGTREYYRIQIVALVVRFIAWTVLQDPSITGLNPTMSPAIHIFMAFFTLITTIASRAAIRFDTKPLVSWSDNLEPLTRKSDGNQRTQLSPPEALKSQTSISGTNQYTPRFPISNLAPVRVLSPEPYNPPTPPPDPADDSDAMDWTPSRQPLQPNFHLNHHQPTPIPGPSPFQGQLPPAPKPLSWQLRNPGRVPAPKPLGMPPNPFHMAPVLQPTSNQPQQTQPVRSSADMVMAPPRFFPESDLKAETGLESLFDKAFSIADSPARKERSSMSKANDRELHINKPLHILKSLFLALCLTLWVGSQSFGLPKTTTETVVLSLSFLVAGFSLLELLMRPMIYWKMIDILLSLAQLVGCVYLALIRTGHFGDQATFDKAGIYLVAFFTGQEIFGLRFMFSAVKPKKVTKQPVKDKKRRPSPPPLDTRAFSISSGERTPTRSTFVPKPPANTKAKSSPAKKQKQPVNFKTPAPLQPLYSRPSTLSRDGILNSLSMPEYPPPTLQNSFSGLTQSQLLSSSFGSTERFMSPTSTASVTSTDYASTISEPPSPELAGRHRTPGPSIMSLSLDDSPAVPAGNTGPAPRYSLRSRRR